MSENLLLHQDQTSTSAKVSTLRAMRWFFLVLVSLWIFVAMILPIIAFCLTKNSLCLTVFGTLAPPLYILYRIVIYLFPKDDRDYKIKLARISARYAQSNSKKRHHRIRQGEAHPKKKIRELSSNRSKNSDEE